MREVFSIMSSVEYLFSVAGGFEIDKRLTPIFDAAGVICGFRRGNTEYRLAICLIAERGGVETVAVSDRELAEAGFTCLDYSDARFDPASGS